jgi:hypothetical protein
MRPIKQHEMKGHVQRLREIFNRRFESRLGATYQLKPDPFLSPVIYLGLDANSCTVSAKSDRGKDEICAVLVTVGKKRILCSVFEAWKTSGKDRFQFDQASLTFFLEFDEGSTRAIRQIFRLEWENWQLRSPSNKAAYPHWQFDTWLTASDATGIERLRKNFIELEETVAVFESAERQIASDDAQRLSDRPDLGWFTRLHFPAIAPWAQSPIRNLDDPNEAHSHRTVPESPEQLEAWIDSALRYLQNEMAEYA